MIFDPDAHLGAVERSVSSHELGGRPVRSVTLARSYDTTLEDLWDAVTNGGRLPRWFLPVAGDLQAGGRYQLEGNAGGAITICARPAHFALTWEYAGHLSWIEVRLAAEGEARARLTLIHTAFVNEHWDRYGPGAVGVGWELGLLGLAAHLAEPEAARFDEAAFAVSPAGRRFIQGSSDAFAGADIAAGADASAALAAARRTSAFYAGEAEP